MSILLTSPAFLLAIPALRRYGRSRLVDRRGPRGPASSCSSNLMHFSQGWVQFGYRFSNDFVPFALLLVALGIERLARGAARWAMPLGDRPRGRLDRGQRLGRRLGQHARVVSRASLGGGRDRSVGRWLARSSASSPRRARVALMPGVGFWDTAELQTVRRSWARPTRPATRRTCCSAGSRIVLAPVRRAGVPDEPVRRRCRVARRGRRDGRPRPGPDPLDDPRRRRPGSGWRSPRRVGDRHPGRGARAPPGASSRSCCPLLVAWEDRVTAPRPDVRAADRYLVAAAVVFGLAVGNHSLTLLLAPGSRCSCSPSSRGSWRRPRLVAAVRRRAGRHRRARLPRAAAARRAVPRAAGLRPPATWDGFWYIVLAEQFRGSLVDPFGDLPAKLGRRSADRDGRRVRAARRAAPGRLRRDGRCAARATRC